MKLHERFDLGARILLAIDERRMQRDDSNVGSSIERLIVNRELAELEAEWYRHPAPKQVRTVVRRRRA
jgi:hypothetical protein